MSDYRWNVLWHIATLAVFVAALIADHSSLGLFIAVPIAWAAFFPNRKAYDADGQLLEEFTS